MKVELVSRVLLKKSPSGTLKSGTRLEDALDVLTSAQAAGAPPGANVIISERQVIVTWEEDR